eukprot:TRINITY_DN10799_c0_g1_i1.p1 TRINITY_DN10799_c0_g1~~TRINITY_DN10799_c0_g1_i1.p1  ORF type:complete len:689 (-),score=144.87 TRINITY_DN10799_c0_g1_i1:273-2339(-)
MLSPSATIIHDGPKAPLAHRVHIVKGYVSELLDADRDETDDDATKSRRYTWSLSKLSLFCRGSVQVQTAVGDLLGNSGIKRVFELLEDDDAAVRTTAVRLICDLAFQNTKNQARILLQNGVTHLGVRVFSIPSKLQTPFLSILQVIKAANPRFDKVKRGSRILDDDEIHGEYFVAFIKTLICRYRETNNPYYWAFPAYLPNGREVPDPRDYLLGFETQVENTLDETEDFVWSDEIYRYFLDAYTALQFASNQTASQSHIPLLNLDRIGGNGDDSNAFETLNQANSHSPRFFSSSPDPISGIDEAEAITAAQALSQPPPKFHHTSKHSQSRGIPMNSARRQIKRLNRDRGLHMSSSTGIPDETDDLTVAALLTEEEQNPSEIPISSSRQIATIIHRLGTTAQVSRPSSASHGTLSRPSSANTLSRSMHLEQSTTSNAHFTAQQTRQLKLETKQQTNNNGQRPQSATRTYSRPVSAQSVSSKDPKQISRMSRTFLRTVEASAPLDLPLQDVAPMQLTPSAFASNRSVLSARTRDRLRLAQSDLLVLHANRPAHETMAARHSSVSSDRGMGSSEENLAARASEEPQPKAPLSKGLFAMPKKTPRPPQNPRSGPGSAIESRIRARKDRERLRSRSDTTGELSSLLRRQNQARPYHSPYIASGEHVSRGSQSPVVLMLNFQQLVMDDSNPGTR